MEWVFIVLTLAVALLLRQRARCQRDELEAEMMQLSRKDAMELARLATFPEENPNIIIETNLHGGITYANPACRARFAVECTDCCHPLLTGLEEKLANFEQSKWQDFDDEVAIAGGIFNRRIKYIAESSLVRIYGFDITHLKEVEQALEQAKQKAEEASSLKNIFLANMSHEIRTPLNAIIGYTDLMMIDAEKSSDRERLTIINRSGKNLLELINDILDLSKIEAGKLDVVLEEFSFCQTIDHIKQLFSGQAADKKLDFRVSCPGILPGSVIGDAKRITQVIVNLLSNSFKFTEIGSVSLSCAYENSIVVMTVADTGIGISKEQQQDIFMEFQQGDANTTRKYGGTGLGLSITRRLVDLMGGTIFLASEEGKGSTFSVRLPLPEGTSVGAVVQSGAAEPVSSETLMNALARVSSGLRVLLAEDDVFNQGLIRQMLKKINVDIVIADNGQEALDRLHEADFDLLLLDMQMPVLNGMQTIEQIRKNNAWNKLHVIALTGEAQEGDAEKFINAGCDDYLPKPMNLDEFYGKMYALISGKFSVDGDGLFSGEEEDVSAAAEREEQLALTPELRALFDDIIDGLKNNMKIFDPEQIYFFAASLDDFDSDSRVVMLQKELQQVAASFDDEALPSIVRQLESL